MRFPSSTPLLLTTDGIFSKQINTYALRLTGEIYFGKYPCEDRRANEKILKNVFKDLIEEIRDHA